MFDTLRTYGVVIRVKSGKMNFFFFKKHVFSNLKMDETDKSPFFCDVLMAEIIFFHKYLCLLGLTQNPKKLFDLFL